MALDRAGNKGISPVVRVPGEQNSTVGLPKPGGPAWSGKRRQRLPQPRIDYVGTLDFNVDYTVQRMGRSGVQAAHLFVLKETGTWDRVDRYPVEAQGRGQGPTFADAALQSRREGTYGFYVIPESGGGQRADDPKKDDSADGAGGGRYHQTVRADYRRAGEARRHTRADCRIHLERRRREPDAATGQPGMVCST